jgi:anti-sigma regulatory factor (Ser/Thr protein kinase)
MTPTTDFEIRNSLDELEPLVRGISDWCQQRSFSQETIYEVSLIVDEVVSNIIRHGFKDGGEHRIQISVWTEGDDMAMAVRDEGVAFDPLLMPAPDLTRPMDERKPGGLGIFMVKQLTQEILYRREDGRNVLLLKKRPALEKTPGDPGAA